MTTPDRVAELLREDERLTDEQRAALADLFRVAYEQMLNTDQLEETFQCPKM